jgi:uncharacterized membrane protein YvbJ
MKDCTNCGAALEDDAKVCNVCGAYLIFNNDHNVPTDSEIRPKGTAGRACCLSIVILGIIFGVYFFLTRGAP